MASVYCSCCWWFICWFICGCVGCHFSFSLKHQRLALAEGRLLGDWYVLVFLLLLSKLPSICLDISYSPLAVFGTLLGFVVVCTESLRFFSIMLGGFYVFWHKGQTFLGFLSSWVHTWLQCWRSAEDCPLQSIVPFTSTNFTNPEKEVQPNTPSSKYFVNSNSYWSCLWSRIASAFFSLNLSFPRSAAFPLWFVIVNCNAVNCIEDPFSVSTTRVQKNQRLMLCQSIQVDKKVMSILNIELN